MLIKIETVLGLAIIAGQTAATARAFARAWLRHSPLRMGGGDTATVSVGCPGGRWHRVGQVGNPGRR